MDTTNKDRNMDEESRESDHESDRKLTKLRNKRSCPIHPFISR